MGTAMDYTPETVFSSSAPFEPGDQVVTDFYRAEKYKIRMVKSVFKAAVNGKKVWYVMTECGFSLDAKWFEKNQVTFDENWHRPF